MWLSMCHRTVQVFLILVGLSLTAVKNDQTVLADRLVRLQRPSESAEKQKPLAKLASFEGSWIAQGKGFSSTLTYEWALPGVLLRGRNELHNEAGGLVGQYEGLYAWDPARSRIVFLTAGRDGELHQGEAEWRHEQLWHKAVVSGGKITGYRSLLEAVGTELHYRASYGDSATDKKVLDSTPLVYRRLKP